MSDRAHIRIELQSDPSYLAGVRQMIAQVAERIGFDETTCSKVALAVDEALANVIRHGYGRAADKPIWVSLWPERGEGGAQASLRIEIEDEAKQVEECELCGRDLDDPKPGGLGVHIIREVMDEVRYEKRSPKGMRLVMFKRVGQPAAREG